MTPLILSAIAGFFIARYVAGDCSGIQGRIRSIRIRVKEYILHVHHWLSASLALVVLPSGVEHKTVIESFLVGVIIQGLTYRDFYKIVYKGNCPA